MDLTDDMLPCVYGSDEVGWQLLYLGTDGQRKAVALDAEEEGDAVFEAFAGYPEECDETEPPVIYA